MLDTAGTQNLILIIGAIATAVALIIRTLRGEQFKTRTILIAGQQAGALRGRVRDKKVQEIHILSNGRLKTALGLVMTLTKREAERTGRPEDIAAYEAALEQVRQNEEATQTILLGGVDDSEDAQLARQAEQRLEDLTGEKI